MGIITLRLNEAEEKMLEHLQSFYDVDKSKILKEAMLEKFEELRDRDIIEGYEKKLMAKKIEFETADELINSLGNKGKPKGRLTARSNRKPLRSAK